MEDNEQYPIGYVDNIAAQRDSYRIERDEALMELKVLNKLIDKFIDRLIDKLGDRY